MKTAILVSKCESINPANQTAQFTFNGSLCGCIVVSTELKVPQGMSVVVGAEYLMYVSIGELKENKLTGTILKIKELPRAWDL